MTRAVIFCDGGLVQDVVCEVEKVFTRYEPGYQNAELVESIFTQIKGA